MDEKNEFDEIIKTNFFAKSGQQQTRGINKCGSNCAGCGCPDGEVGTVSLVTVGHAGGYAGDLSLQN
jgi:hypothetical protein